MEALQGGEWKIFIEAEKYKQAEEALECKVSGYKMHALSINPDTP